MTPVRLTIPQPRGFRWGLGDTVRKKSGAQWAGKIVGFYVTDLTPEGYAVESSSEIGSVQIYPVSALQRTSE